MFAYTTNLTNRLRVGELVRSIEVGSLKVKLRPLGACRQPPLDSFARRFMEPPYKSFRQLAAESIVEEMYDQMLIAL